MTKSLYAVAIGAMALVSATSSAAAIILDQSTLAASGTRQTGAQVFAVNGNDTQAAQSFTVGVTGVLNRIEVMVNGDRAGPAMLRVRPVVAGIVTTANAGALGSIAFTVPIWANDPAPGGKSEFGRYSITSIDVSALNLAVTAGQVLAISIETDTPDLIGWAGRTEAYAGGSGFSRFSDAAGAGWDSYVSGLGTNADMFFATYVDTAGVVPEPATWAMLAAGFGMIGAGLRTRRRFQAMPPLTV